MLNFNKKLLELIKENPNTPVMVFSENCSSDEGNFTASDNLYCDLSELTLYEDDYERLYLEKEELETKLEDEMNLSSNELEKYIKENYEFEKYICIYAREMYD